MKTLVQTINEKLKITKHTKTVYKYHPSDINELRVIIKDKCKNCISNILDLTDIDVSKLDTLNSMLSSITLDNENERNIDTIDVTGWDVSNVTNFKSTFDSRLAERITDIYGLDTWDVSKGESFRQFFQNTVKLKNIDGIEEFKFGKGCYDLAYFFHRCESIKNIDLSKWNVENIRWLGGLFFGCTSLKYFSFKNWKTSNVFSMVSMFKNCTSLEEIVDTSDLDLSTCTDITSMFYYCTSLKYIENIENWNVSKLNSIEDTFNNCQKLTCDLSKWKLKTSIYDKRAFFSTSRKLFIKPKIK
jgi:surface protein